MWESDVEVLEDGRARRVVLRRSGRPIEYRDVIDGWQHDFEFRTHFLTILADAPFDAYFWEAPPVTATTLAQQFEFALVDSPALARLAAEPRAFEQHFTGDEDVTVFDNLGRDAILVVPTPLVAPSAYPHLAAFVRRAPETQQHSLWRHVGAALDRRLSRRPVWASTSGLGVAWLHVRLDDRPKYYTFGRYRNAST